MSGTGKINDCFPIGTTLLAEVTVGRISSETSKKDEQIERLQEQLKEANEVIADLSEYPPINTSTRELSFALNRYNAKKYLEKWGVK